MKSRPISFGVARGLALVGACLTAGFQSLHGATLADHARRFDEQIRSKILPYWYDTAVDWERGGYVLSADAAAKVPPASEKQIVTQARMVWAFAHAHLKGYRDARRDYLKAARQGFDFLVSHLRDADQGGYFWKTDLAGKPLSDRKLLYGNAFVVYAFVEFHRASGDDAPLARARELYRDIQRHCHDPAHGGWGEHYTRDWRLITAQDDRIEVEVAGLKSANAHLHWMEALAELYDVTKDSEVGRSLAEAIRINATYFYPPDPGKSAFHRQPDWREVADARSAGLSYGHNVEFAWLLIRAQEALGVPPAWDHFHAVLRHARRFGWDAERGGLYNRGFGDQPATDRDKVWWVQSEMMAALTDSLRHRASPEDEAALQKLIAFLNAHQIDPGTGVWLDTVSESGQPRRTALAHSWKGAYHDLRALMKFVEAFRPQ
jgi:mannobiose 2-epimerase